MLNKKFSIQFKDQISNQSININFSHKYVKSGNLKINLLDFYFIGNVKKNL